MATIKRSHITGMQNTIRDQAAEIVSLRAKIRRLESLNIDAFIRLMISEDRLRYLETERREAAA